MVLAKVQAATLCDEDDDELFVHDGVMTSLVVVCCSPGSLLICHSLATRLRVSPPLPSGRVRSGVSC